MRCDMREKIQFAVCGAEPGKEASLGKFPHTEAVHRGESSGLDSAEKNDEVEARSGHGGTGCDAVSGGSAASGNCGYAARVLIGWIHVYQTLAAPLLPDCCRFTPTCSRYGEEALRVHGLWRGTWLTVWRLLRCQPFCRGGYDPVPPKKSRGFK